MRVASSSPTIPVADLKAGRLYTVRKPGSSQEWQQLFLGTYQAPREAENHTLGGLAVVGAILGLLALTLWLGGAA